MMQNLLGDWAQRLESVSFNEKKFNDILVNLDNRYAFYDVFPKKNDVFKAFKLTQFKDLKVVILGQSPYPNKYANGLCYGADELMGNKIPASLNRIENRIELDVRDGLYFMDYSLEPWAKQGVLLLNASLTVEKNKPNSHVEYWENFTESVINAINYNTTGVIFCLWGDYLVKKYKPLIKCHHHVLKYNSPEYSIVKNHTWNCKHFNQVNDIIEEANGKEFCIKW